MPRVVVEIWFAAWLLLVLHASAQDGIPRDAPIGNSFDKYMIIVLENHDFDNVLRDTNYRAIAAKGLLQTNYHAVTHPSQPNCKYMHFVGMQCLFLAQTSHFLLF